MVHLKKIATVDYIEILLASPVCFVQYISTK